MSTNTTLPLTTATFRRVSHGSTRFSSDPLQFQPQDGAPIAPSKIAAISPRNHPVVAAEPEDARLTGMTRSLYRRLMGLNLRPAAQPEKPLATAANKMPTRKSAPAIMQQQVA